MPRKKTESASAAENLAAKTEIKPSRRRIVATTEDPQPTVGRKRRSIDIETEELPIKTVKPVAEIPKREKSVRTRKVIAIEVEEEVVSVKTTKIVQPKAVKPKAVKAVAKEVDVVPTAAPVTRPPGASRRLFAPPVAVVPTQPELVQEDTNLSDLNLDHIKPTWRAKTAESRPTPKHTPIEAVDTEGRFKILEWRTPDPNAARTDEDDGESEVSFEGMEASQLAPRRTRTKQRRDRQDRDISASAALGEPVAQVPVEAIPEPPVVETPRRIPVAIPETAAQVAMKDGHPVIVKDRKIYPPIVFFASTLDEKSVPTVIEEVKMAAENDINLLSFLIELVVDPQAVQRAVESARKIVQMATIANPHAQVILRTMFSPPAHWEKSFRDAVYTTEGGRLADPSVCDDQFWSVAEDCLESYVQGLRKSVEAKSIMGIHLERGEWFYSEANGYDRSQSAEASFREWLRQRYRGDVVALRAAWFDGAVGFDSVRIPHRVKRAESGAEFVRFARKERRWVDYHLFLSDATGDRLFQLSHTTKKASDGEFLVGVSYGYTFEWSHPASGHLALGKMLRCPDIDYIAGPPSYKNREPGGAAAFPVPIDSFALNGKLYMSEEDFKTPMSGKPEPDDFNPTMKTPQALESVHWRGAGAALAHTAGVAWMDSWGNGWLNSRGIWQRGKIVRDTFLKQLAVKRDPPDVAVLIDERSLALLVDERAFDVLVQSVREAILRSGLSVGFYLLSDLAHRENFPESKMYVFVNAWDIRPEVRSAIKSRLQRDNKLIFWLYAAGLFEGGRESLERVREVTGIALKPQPFLSKPGTTILNFRDPICNPLPENLISQGGHLEPSYFAIPEDATVLGEYSQTGLPSYVVRKFKADGESHAWTSVFLGEPIVTPGLFRALGQMAGVHVWSFNDDVVHVTAPFLTIHCTGAGQRTLTLPDKWVAFNLNTQEWVTVEGNSLKFMAIDGSTHSFVVGTVMQAEAVVNAKLDDLTTMTGPLGREENTVHWDAVQFEVPIMKLDEWVEETWSEKLADDLLLRPSMLDVESDSVEENDDPSLSERDRRRMKRRRGRRTRSGGDETDGARRESGTIQGDGNTGINFLFRKRQ